MMSIAPSPKAIRDIYTRMLLTRIVDDCALSLYTRGYIQFIAGCRGHEAAQVASAMCIEVGTDFTLPYYRDLGVVLTIGMTPYEVFRTYLQTHQHHASSRGTAPQQASDSPSTQHWGYHKHNTITGPMPVATQLLHAAGIAFACKLRKTSAVAVAYCGDEAVNEPDFLESLRFAAQHKLPAIFVCEYDCSQQISPPSPASSCTQSLTLPDGLRHEHVNGTDGIAVYTATQRAIEHARAGHGPTLLEMAVARPLPDLSGSQTEGSKTWRETYLSSSSLQRYDPLARCQRSLEELGAWDEMWARQLAAHLKAEVERALEDALRDTLQLTR